MTARLPTPGGDDNTWGDILNSYLETSLNADGTLKTSAVSAAGAEQTANKGVAGGYAQLDGSTKIPIALLPATTLSSNSDVNISSPANNQGLIYNSGTGKWTNQVLPSAPVTSVAGRTGAVVLAVADVTNAESTANKTTDGTLAANSDTLYPSQKATKTYVDSSVAAGTPDANATTKGKLKLANDLGGTADLPTVPRLAPVFNVKTYGAVGDGTTDDSAAIQAAIDACDPSRGGNVYFPQGRYRIATGLIINNQGTVLIGEGKPGTSRATSQGSTRIISDNGVTAITCNTGGSHATLGFGFKNLHVLAASGATSGNGILVQNSEKTIVENLTCSDYVAGYGLRLDGLSGSGNAQYSELIVYQAGNCLYGLHLTGGAPNGTTLFGGYYEGNTTPIANSVAIYVETGGEFRLFGTKIQGWATGVYLKGSASGDHELHGPRFEYCNTSLRVATNNCHLYGGSFDNTLLTGPGTPIASSIGIQLDTGADDCVLTPAKRLPVGTMFVMNGGLRPRFPGSEGEAQQAAAVGAVVGRVAQYDKSGTLLGYAPLYDNITGIYLVQDLGLALNNTTGVTTVTRTLTAPVKVGDMVVVGGGYGAASTQTITITDSQSNSWTVQRHDDKTTGATPHSFVASSVVTTALQVGDTITATFGGNVNYPMFFCYDYAGQVAGTILDVAGGATGTSTSPSTGNITTTSDYPLLFSAAYFDNAATFAAGSGFTVLDTQTSTAKRISIETMTGPAASTFAGATGTLSSSVDWAMTVVAFKKAAGTSSQLDPRYDIAGAAAAVLPSQTGNSGKYLTTNGSAASWGTVAAAALTNQSNYLSADVTMTTNGTYYDGPTLTLAAGTWLLTGAVEIQAGSSAIRTFTVKLWDGSTTISIGGNTVAGTATPALVSIPVSGIVTPAGSTTYKISATSSVNGETLKGTGVLCSYLHAVKIG